MSSRAADLLTTNVQGAGANWTAAIWKNNSGGVPTGTAVAPAAGNTYQAIFNGTQVAGGANNTRIRPPTSGNATFPGDSLTMQANTEIRWKTGATGNIMNFPGVNGNPGLILNGGMLNGGDDGTFAIRGYIRVTSPSFISHGSTGGGGSISANRAVDFQGVLDGTGSMEIINSGTTIPNIVSGNSNTFSGQWIVQCGWLQGNGTNSLGTNSILVDPQDTSYLTVMPGATSPTGPAWFEVGYNINSAGTLTLRNGGLMRLHQNCCFAAVNIDGASLSAGTHMYSELTNNYPNNFAAGGCGSITVQPYGTPPLILPQFITQPAPVAVYAGGTVSFAASVLGDQLSFQWLRNGSPLSDGGNVSGSLTSALTLSGVTAADAATYSLRVSNTAGVVTSIPVSLTIAQPSDAAASAVIANGAILYWPLDETGDPSTNTYCYDNIGGKTGTCGGAVQNGFNGVVGPRPSDGFPKLLAANAAAQFSSAPNARITLPPLNLNTNMVSITAWINPSWSEPANAGIVFCRGGTTVAGLTIGTNTMTPTLGYNWNNNASTYNFSSGINPPAGQWSFVGLVITPTNGTLYLINTNSFQTAVNTFTNPPQAFDAAMLIGADGMDNNSGSRAFNGAIDNVAIYNTSLTINQMINLYSAASGVSSFSPSIVVPPQSLAIYAGQTATFSVQAGGPSLSYQWQAAAAFSGGPYTNLANGGQFSGVKTATLNIVNVNNANALDYVVVVSNLSGTTNTYFSPATLTVMPVSPAEAVTMACQQAQNTDWDISSCWSDFNPASFSALSKPGSTYKVLPGARLRTPVASYAVFPTTNLAFGYVPALIVDGNGVFVDNPGATAPIGEIRLKNANPGTVIFPRLIMNGGQIDAGSDGLVTIGGEMDIMTNTPIYVDSGAAASRPIRIESWLTGNGTIQFLGRDNSFGANLNIAGTSNTFSGTWNVVMGPLLGSGTNSLGTNSITVGPNGDLETSYDLNSPNATLRLNGQMLLHQNDTIGAMYVNDVPVPPGTYTYAQLAAAYPSNFPATWTLLTGAVTNRASGSITVRTAAPQLPVTFSGGLGIATNAASAVGAAVTYSVSAGGSPPFSYQWYVDGKAVAGATTSSFAFTPGAAGTHSIYVVVQNGSVPATNGPAMLVANPVGTAVTFADTVNWTLQGVGITPSFSPNTTGGNLLTLTTDAGNQSASAFYNVGQYIGAFKASFVYMPNGSLAADGATFCLQNSARGPAALGGGGGSLAYVGITNSVVVAMNLYSPSTAGIGFASGGGAAPTYQDTAPVNIATGNPITAEVSWQGNVSTANGQVIPSPLQVVLKDAIAGTQFSTNYDCGDLTSLTGGSVAYVGFTAATGGSFAGQQIDNFSFQYLAAPVPAVLSVNAGGSGSMTISWPAGVAASYHLQQSASLSGPWSNVATTPTVVNGFNQVVVSSGGASQFYRLISQ